MKRLPPVIGVILLVALVAVPASAFQAQDLSISVQQNGDTVVDFSYHLNWLEQVAVFTRIVNPSQELASAIERNYPDVSVTVSQVRSDETTFVIHSFAHISTGPGGTTYTTPALSFQNAQRVLNQYWFAPLIQPDFSPKITQISFPDGYQENFYNQIAIPAISHTV
jgi:hypothetical protein